MHLKTIDRIFNILGFILNKPNCTAPEIRDYLGIKHKGALSNEEKQFYALLKKLEKEGYLFKISIQKKGSGGAQFRLRLSDMGFSFLSQIRSMKFFLTKYPSSDLEKEKSDGLEKVTRVYASEVFDIILDAIERVVYDTLLIHFENLPFSSQKEVVDTVNNAAERIKNKTSEIAKIFF